MKILKTISIIALSLLITNSFAQNDYSGKKGEPNKKGTHCSPHGHGKHGKMSPEMKAKIMEERAAFDDNLSDAEKLKIKETRTALKGFRKEMKGLDKSTITKEEWEKYHQKKKNLVAPLFDIASEHKDELMAVAKRLHGDKAGNSYDGKGKCCEGNSEKCKKDWNKKEWDKKGKEDPKEKSDKEKGDYGDKGNWDKKKKEDWGKKGECSKGKEDCHGKKGGHHHGKMKYMAFKFLLLDPSKKEKIEEPNINIFPNPSIDRNTITFNHPLDGIIIVDLIDKEGKVVKQVLNEFREAGLVEVTFDVNPLNAGDMYFYRINDNGNVQTKKFLMAD